MQDLSSEVAAEETPGWAIYGRGDVMLITVYNSVGWPLRTISKNDTILDQHLVGKGVGGDEDGWVKAHLESDDWAILGV